MILKILLITKAIIRLKYQNQTGNTDIDNNIAKLILIMKWLFWLFLKPVTFQTESFIMSKFNEIICKLFLTCSFSKFLLLQMSPFILANRSKFPSSLNEGAVVTVSLLEAILFKSLTSTSCVTPKTCTMIPFSFIPRDALSSGVNFVFVVCRPSVITSATCRKSLTMNVTKIR